MINSPVFDFLKRLITFDKKQPQPLYVQASQQIINGIQRGNLSKGTLLPGTRKLSKLLHINRNTAVAIYDELASQGWVEIIPNKGTYVIEPKQRSSKLKVVSHQLNSTYNYPAKTGFSFQESFHLSSTEETTSLKYSLNDGKPDLRLHPVHQFTRWYSATIKRKVLLEKWNQQSIFSKTLFYNQLCNYLNVTRGFHINPTNIVSTRSAEMSLYIVSQLLIKPNDVVIVGELSNYAANMIFQQVGAKLTTIPVDDQGLDIDFLKNNFSKNDIRCVYISSQRDYPTTATLSVERRLQLLTLAKDYDFAIIEDDYDYDFQLDGFAMPPLASAAIDGRVVYLGKLGESLFPSYQMGFIVAPKNLISEAKNYLQLVDKQGDLVQEQMLSELISEGEIYRLMKKNTLVYKERRDCLVELLAKYFGTVASWNIPSGGLAIWIEFEPQISLIKLTKEAEKLDVFIPKTILYQNTKTCAIRFGFGHLTTEEIRIIIPKLKNAYLVLIKKKNTPAFLAGVLFILFFLLPLFSNISIHFH